MRPAPTHRNSWPKKFAPWRERGLFAELPFGTDFTAEEIVLSKALRSLASGDTILARPACGSLLDALFNGSPVPAVQPHLARMGLDAGPFPVTSRATSAPNDRSSQNFAQRLIWPYLCSPLRKAPAEGPATRDRCDPSNEWTSRCAGFTYSYSHRKSFMNKFAAQLL